MEFNTMPRVQFGTNSVLDRPSTTEGLRNANISAASLPGLPKKEVSATNRPETPRVTISLSNTKRDLPSIPSPIQQSELPPRPSHSTPTNNNLMPVTQFIAPTITKMDVVGVDQIVALLTGSIIGLERIYKHVPDASKIARQLEEIKASISSRETEINQFLTPGHEPKSPTGNNPLLSPDMVYASSPTSPMPQIPFSSPTPSSSSVDLSHWLYQVQKYSWILHEKIKKYQLNPITVLNAPFRKKKMFDFCAEIRSSWVNLLLHLTLAMSESSRIQADTANDDVHKLAVATGAENWQDLNVNDAENLYLQGEKHFLGCGVPRSLDVAFKRYESAANIGLSKASNMLGIMFEFGLGREKDITLATQWFKKAARAHNPDALNNLGRIFETGKGCEVSMKLAAEYYKRSSELGSLDGMTNFGYMLEHGLGRQQDLSHAVEMYRMAADLGYARAQNALGSCYYRGRGISRDYSKAVTWYRKSAEQGFPPAQNNLGICFEEGNGVEKDLILAKAYYLRAAEGHHPNGTNNLGFLFLLEGNYMAAMQQFHLAMALGSIEAAYHLGTMNEAGCQDEKGNVITRNVEMALRYYEFAAVRGHVKSQVRIATVIICLQPEDPKAFEKGIYYLRLAATGEKPAGPPPDAPSQAGSIANTYGISTFNQTFYRSPWQVSKDTSVSSGRSNSSQGDANAQNMLGELYELGKIGDAEDSPSPEQASHWYRLALQQGHARATFNLAALYETGEGVDKDFEKAIKLYEEAVRRGNPEAQQRLRELASLAFDENEKR